MPFRDGSRCAFEVYARACSTTQKRRCGMCISAVCTFRAYLAAELELELLPRSRYNGKVGSALSKIRTEND